MTIHNQPWFYVVIQHRDAQTILAFTDEADAKGWHKNIADAMAHPDADDAPNPLTVTDAFGTMLTLRPKSIISVRFQTQEGGRIIQVNGQIENARVNQEAQKAAEIVFGKAAVQPVTAQLTDRNGRPIRAPNAPGRSANIKQ